MDKGKEEEKGDREKERGENEKLESTVVLYARDPATYSTPTSRGNLNLKRFPTGIVNLVAFLGVFRHWFCFSRVLQRSCRDTVVLARSWRDPRPTEPMPKIFSKSYGIRSCNSETLRIQIGARRRCTVGYERSRRDKNTVLFSFLL